LFRLRLIPARRSARAKTWRGSLERGSLVASPVRGDRCFSGSGSIWIYLDLSGSIWIYRDQRSSQVETKPVTAAQIVTDLVLHTAGVVFEFVLVVILILEILLVEFVLAQVLALVEFRGIRLTLDGQLILVGLAALVRSEHLAPVFDPVTVYVGAALKADDAHAEPPTDPRREGLLVRRGPDGILKHFLEVSATRSSQIFWPGQR